MKTWSEIIEQINEISSCPGRMTGSCAFYRGQSDARWDLMPGLGRLILEPETESHLFYEFLSHGGYLIPGSGKEAISTAVVDLINLMSQRK